VARSPAISDEQILDAARAEFMERGFQASTAAIARRAGVSEGTVFKRFPSKERLFVECMDFRRMDELVTLLEALPDRPSAAGALEELIAAIIVRLRIAFPRMMMMWANTSPDRLFAGMANPPPLRLLQAVGDWLGAETRRGRLSVQEPEVAARMILGSCLHFVFFEATGLAPGRSEASFAVSLREALCGGIGGGREVQA
jgi:AcrR family transcriptional regulator